jgi:hypothetical protein
MSIKKPTIKYSAAAAVLAIAVIAGSAFYLGFPQSQGSASVQGPGSLLVIQLTDPPQVPRGTTSLNLTYTNLALLVGEPSGQGGRVNTKTISLAPKGGSATLDLLKLQNMSQTIASANLTQGSTIYSVTFTISGFSIDVNGTLSAVVLASGGNSLTVTLAHASELHGTNVALIQLNPTVVDTPSGFRLIPSAVGILRPSQGGGEDHVGYKHDLSGGEDRQLDGARGNVTATLVTLTVSGNSSTIIVHVVNTGNLTVQLNAIGLHGEFTSNWSDCSSNGKSDKHWSNTNDSSCNHHDHPSEAVFAPVVQNGATTTTTTTSTTTNGQGSCINIRMQQVSGDTENDNQDGGLTLNPGQCVNLTFSGIITFGDSSHVLIPSSSTGSSYTVHIIASNGANLKLDCTLPLGTNACKADQNSKYD